MTLERIQPEDRRLLWIALAVIAVSGVYVRYNYRAAFPQASINLRYSRQEITAMAERAARQHAWRTEGFRNLTVFDSDEHARFYLERELGLEEANRLMQGPVSVWQWKARWFRPPGKEEIVMTLAPDGKLVGFQHQVAEAAPGARLDQEAARRLAQRALEEQTRLPHKLIEERLEERPNRYDHVFTWEQEGFKAKEATYRRTIVVQGGEVASYNEYLHVPEQWSRDFSALRSKNELYTTIATALAVPIVLAGVVFLIQGMRRRQIRWGPLVWFSVAVGALMTLNSWNSLPFFIYSMPTSTSYPESVVIGLLQGLGFGLAIFLFVIVAAAAGAPLYRALLPGKLSLPAAVSARSLRSREFFRACVTGYGFAAGHIAFVVAFYLVGRRFGVWAPQDVEYSNLLSTAIPWIAPLAISLLASASEEFWFRLLPIPLLLRWVPSRWLAVTIPAFIWGFLHANYPQQPGYIRGIEVGVIGVAAGWLMLRFGILSTLIWHYTVDAVMIGTFLLQSDSWYFRVSGVVVGSAVLLPLLISLWQYQRNGGFPVTEEEPVAAAAAEEAEAPREPGAAPLGPSLPLRWLFVAAAVVLAAALLFKPPRFADFVKVRILPHAASQIADRALRARGVDPGAWRRVVEFRSGVSGSAMEYLRRLAGPARAKTVVGERTMSAYWSVRYFQPLRKEEWRIEVDQRGQVIRSRHALDEKAPGAKLPGEAARQLAEKYLRETQRIDLEGYRLVDSSETKRDNRTDHGFVWEDWRFREGEATARISVGIIGDEPSDFERFLKLPEQWLREFSRPRLQSLLIPAASGGVLLLLLVPFLRALGRHHFRWRVYLGVTGGVMALSLAARLNRWPLFFAGYQTDKPFHDYVSEALLTNVIGVLMAGMGAFLAVLALDVYLRMAPGGAAVRPASLWRVAGLAGLIFGASRAVRGLEWRIPGDRFGVPLPELPGVDAAAPAGEVLASAAFSTLAAVCLVGIAGAAAGCLLSARSRVIWALGIAAVLAGARAATIPLGVYHFAATLAALALAWLVFRTCAVDLFSLTLAWFWLEAASGAARLLEQPAAMLRMNGAAVLVVAMLAGLWAYFARFRRGAVQ